MGDTAGDEGVDTTTSEAAPSRHHPWRWVALGAVLVVTVAVSVVAITYATRERPQARSLDDAAERLGRTATSVAGAGAAMLPEPGVYTAVGRGREAISFPPNSQDDGRIMPASVEHLGDDCFRFRVDYNEAHWHQWDLCHREGAVVLVEQRNSQRWDFGSLTVENVGQYVCDPPATWVPAGAADGSADGDVTRGTCTGSNSAAPGASTATDRTTTVGVDRLRIGGRRVAAVHLRQRTELTGAQTGRNLVDLWLDASTGLPLRFVRDYRVDTESPVGTITYTEEGEWQLRSTRPRTTP